MQAGSATAISSSMRDRQDVPPNPRVSCRSQLARPDRKSACTVQPMASPWSGKGATLNPNPAEFPARPVPGGRPLVEPIQEQEITLVDHLHGTGIRIAAVVVKEDADGEITV